MTVSELRKILENLPDDAPVVRTHPVDLYTVMSVTPWYAGIDPETSKLFWSNNSGEYCDTVTDQDKARGWDKIGTILVVE